MSDKLHIVDRSTFEDCQQRGRGRDVGEPRIIRNAKYKKTRNSFNLMQFLAFKPKKTAGKRRRSGRKEITFPVRTKSGVPKRKRGKQREGGRKISHSRLKKSIIRYRLKKRMNEEFNEEVEDVTTNIDTLQLNFDTTICSNQPVQINTSRIHSSRFRDYCDNCTTEKLYQLSEQLLRELNRFQRRAYAVNEIKAHAHRRFVVGFREVQNFMTINKIKMIFIATDCEKDNGKDGLDETIANLKTQCREKQIPCIFPMRRRQIAYTLYKKVPVSCIGILDYDGVRDIFSQLLEEILVARNSYQELLQNTLT